MKGSRIPGFKGSSEMLTLYAGKWGYSKTEVLLTTARCQAPSDPRILEPFLPIKLGEDPISRVTEMEKSYLGNEKSACARKNYSKAFEAPTASLYHSFRLVVMKSESGVKARR